MAIKPKGKPARDLNNMMCLDVFLMMASKEEQEEISRHLSPPTHQMHPLLSWDIVSMEEARQNDNTRRQLDCAQLEKLFGKKGWLFDWSVVLTQPYEALVLTDLQKTILWVNKGFTSMTGYPKKKGIGNRPDFLQGPKTSEESRKRIRQQLAAGKPFSEDIINHRKDKSDYICRVTIFPVHDRSHEIRAFLAFETEVK